MVRGGGYRPGTHVKAGAAKRSDRKRLPILTLDCAGRRPSRKRKINSLVAVVFEMWIASMAPSRPQIPTGQMLRCRKLRRDRVFQILTLFRSGKWQSRLSQTGPLLAILLALETPTCPLSNCDFPRNAKTIETARGAIASDRSWRFAALVNDGRDYSEFAHWSL